jgi:hypothetical protein
MNKIFTADWHLSDSPNTEYRWGIFPYLHKIVNLYHVNSLYILGDLTDKKNYHDAKFVMRLIDEFEGLAEESTVQEIIILKGNHDYTDEKSPFFSFLKNFKKIQYVTYPINFDKEQWLPNTRNFDYKLDGSARYIFMHQPVANARIGENRFLKNGLSVDLFKGISDNVIFAGDIHYGQKIGNVTYVGAPYHINFGDLYQGRIFFIEEDKITEIETVFPSKVLIEVDSEELMSVDSFFKMTTKFPLKKEDFVKVIVKVHQNDKYKWEEFRKKIKKLSIQDNLYLNSSELKLIKEDFSEEVVKKVVGKKEDEQTVVKKFLEKENLGDFYFECAKEVME